MSSGTIRRPGSTNWRSRLGRTMVTQLGWEPHARFAELVEIMLKADLREAGVEPGLPGPDGDR